MTTQWTKLVVPKSRSHKSWNDRCLDTWTLEVLAAVFSVSCFVAICAILGGYDGKARPDLHFGLSLNAIISVLATGCKSSLMFTIGEALSQAKWVRFRNSSTPLVDMQTFDSASRGPLGAMMMLFHKRPSVATFGAAIVVLMLAFDPFVQQITKYPTRSAPIRDGTGVAVAKRLTYFLPSIDSPRQWSMTYSSGLWSDDNLLHPECSSGNCTWPVSRSVGMCAKCDDVNMKSISLHCERKPYINQTYTEWLNGASGSDNFELSCHIMSPLGNLTLADPSFAIGYEDDYRHVDFPEHSTWHAYSGYDFLTDAFEEEHTDNFTFAGITNPLMVIAYAEMEYDTSFFNASDPVRGLKIKKLTGCCLTFCLSDWRISVSQGTTQAEASDIEFGHLFWRYIDNKIIGKTLCWKPKSSPPHVTFEDRLDADGFLIPPSLSPTQFAFCGINSFVYPIGTAFAGSSEVGCFSRGGKVERIEPVGAPGNASTERITHASLEHVMSNVANSINKMALTADGEDVNGTALGIEVFVEVQWPWIIFPGLLVVFGITFFAIAVSTNNDTSLWKSSIFAFLYHGLEGIDTEDCPTASTMERKAADISVQLTQSPGKDDSKLREEQKF
ncbi:unnamed protein product [Penicillium salamii]|nr:unnamed protein product [Penicillium salamii]